MALKIKFNDDRIAATITALLLITREHMHHGDTVELIARAIATYREDPAAFKARFPVRDREAARDPGVLANTKRAITFQRLNETADRLLGKIKQARRQFSSLDEMDNYIAFSLQPVLEPPVPASRREPA